MTNEASYEKRALSPKRVLRGWRKLRKWAIQRVEEGQSVAVVCGVLAVSRAFYYKWHARWIEGGKAWSSLEDRSSRPRTIHTKREKIVPDVVSTRVQFVTWGARKIRAHLQRERPESVASHQTIHRVLVEHGLVNNGPKKRRVWRAWARRHANSLWQTDLKQLTTDPSGPWLVTFLDDASRLILACKILPSTPTADEVLTVLHAAIKTWGKPRQILTDRGAQYYANKGGESRFTTTLRDLGIEHIKAGVRKPTTTGKVERWHRTFADELVRICPDVSKLPEHLPKYLEVYNTIRPHEGIEYEIPILRYFGTLIHEESV